MLVKGDQLPLAIKITNEEQIVTPSQISDLRVRLNSKIYTYSKGEVSYNSGTQKWELPITQESILDFGDILEVSIQVNFGGNPKLIKTSPTQRLVIQDSLFKEIWG